MIPYDAQFDPPAIVLQATVAGVVHQRPQIALSALVDTGADITAIPKNLVDRLRLYPIGRLLLENASAVTTPVFTYEATVITGEGASKRLEVVTSPYPFVILGRDWLQDYYLILNGPDQHFQLSKTPLND